MNKFYLLADDDNDDAELFAEALTSIDSSIEFCRAENGKEVFTLVGGSKKPDIIFLDLNMPEMSGWQCLARLKNDPELKTIPVIMYSTSSIKRDKEIALELGAVGFITKPSSFNSLISILSSIVTSPTSQLKSAVKDLPLLI